MKQRAITGLLILSVVIPAFLIGGIPFNILVFMFIALGVYEVYALRKEDWHFWIYFLMVSLVLLLSNLSTHYLTLAIFILVLSMMSLPVLFEWFKYEDAGYLISMILLFTGALSAVLYIAKLGRLELVYMLVAAYATDTGAYFAGYLFGKHKLNERISPKKTIEGAIGGWLVSFILSSLFAYYFVRAVDFQTMLIASAILPVVAQLGDLALSVIKRHFNVKDFGSIFPAHGGILDRIDSLLFVLITFYLILMF